MVCNLLDIGHKIRMWVSIHNPFVRNLTIAKSLNQYNYPWIINCTITFLQYACISAMYTKFWLSSSNCDIVVKDILEPRHWCTNEMEVILTILPDWSLSLLQHPKSIEYGETISVIPAVIHQINVYISPWSVTHRVLTIGTQPSLSRSQPYQVLQILHHALLLHHVVTSNAQILVYNYYVWELYGGAHVFILVHSTPDGQHQVLENVTRCLLVCLVQFYMHCLWPTAKSCIHTQCSPGKMTLHDA